MKKKFMISRRMMGFTMVMVIILVLWGNSLNFILSQRLYHESAAIMDILLDENDRWVDRQLKTMDDMLSGVVFNSLEFRNFSSARGNEDGTAYALKTLIGQVVPAETPFNLIFFFHDNDSYINAYIMNYLSSQDSIAVSDRLKSFQQSLTGENGNDWVIWNIEDQQYLVRWIKYEYACVGSLVLLDELSPSGNIPGEIIWESQDSDPQSLEDDQVVAVSRDLSEAPFRLVYEIPKSELNGEADLIRRLLIFFSVLLILTIPLSGWYLKKYLLSPLDRLKKMIVELKDQELDTSVSEADAGEIQEVFDLFEQFVSEIKHLKIESYEAKLAQEKYRLDYLRLQLNPHFYLNSLKGIYGLAQMKDYEKIQIMVREMSKYFRYIVYNDTALVQVKEELEHVKTYIHIQSIQSSYPIRCDLEMDAALKEIRIPTLCIQTFVENSVKYASQTGSVLSIHIKVQRLEGEDRNFIKITVSDNGKGYSKELIQKVNHEQMSGEGHVGLSNLKNRLNILYKTEAFVRIYNSGDGGAVSEIMIPVS